jgi:hypothetical protein
MKKLLPIILLLFFTICCANARQIQLQPFSTLVVSGPLRLNIVNGVLNDYLIVQGSEANMKNLKVNVPHHKLYLSSTKPLSININAQHLQNIVVAGDYNLIINVKGDSHWYLIKKGAGNLIIRGPIALSDFDYFGSGSVKINDLRDLLGLNYNGSGDMVLNGVAHLVGLKFNGSGHLTMRWIDSCVLNVTACGCGLIELAGVAKVVQADVHGSVDFDARFLRTHIAGVSAYDCARADIFALDNMFTVANNFSNIYYYHKPPFFYREMNNSGSILDMSRLPGAYVNF